MSASIVLLLFSLSPIGFLSVRYPKVFSIVTRDLRSERILHYFLLYLLGTVLYCDSFTALSAISPTFLIHSLVYLLCLVYAAFFAIAVNNKEDLVIDRVSNPNRPLVLKKIHTRTYMQLAVSSLVASFIFSAFCGIHYFLTILGISLIYWCYSAPPFRLKRFVFLAKFLIGINSLLSACCGYVAAGGNWQQFPVFWLIFILGPISLLANFIDLKDLEGDRAGGIKTLPVRIGLHKTKRVLSVFAFITYCFVAYFFQSWVVVLLLIIGLGIHIFVLFREPYREKTVFLLHNSLLLGLIVLFLLRNFVKQLTL